MSATNANEIRPVTRDDLALAREVGDQEALVTLARRARREGMHWWAIAQDTGLPESRVKAWRAES